MEKDYYVTDFPEDEVKKKIMNTLLIIFVVISIIILIIAINKNIELNKYEKICENTPTELFKEKCTIGEDCLKVCSLRLYNENEKT